MSDIFNRAASNLAGVFTADRAKLVFADGNLGVLVQRLTVSYMQRIVRLFEIGANGPNQQPNVYFVAGRAEGTLSVDRIVGPAGTMGAFYTRFGDVCSVGRNKDKIRLSMAETDCASGESTPVNYTMSNPVITQVSFGVAAENMLITESMVLMFTALEVQ